MEKTVCARAVIKGKVQGVFFRMETKRAADRIGVCGWVRNRSDGTVEALFEGDHNKVIEALEWCKQGSPLSRVTSVDVEWKDFSGAAQGFEIRYA